MRPKREAEGPQVMLLDSANAATEPVRPESRYTDRNAW